MFQKLLITALILGLAAFVGGCSSEATLGNVNDISEEFGGYEPTDEEPAFGSEMIAKEMTADVEYDDPMLVSSEVEDVIASDSVDAYALRIVWGQLRYDSTVTDVTDWTGSLTVSDGAEVIRRVIKFELGQDYILTRTDRSLIEWVSYTTVHHDGIFVNLFVPKPDESTEAEPITVTFSTAPFEITFDVADLAELDTVYYLDDSNAVAFQAFRIERHDCAKGFLDGRWGVDENGAQIFYGRWMSRFSELEGHLEGTWGDNRFYGKYIDTEGKFEGLLKGVYHHGNSVAPKHRLAGWFRGYFYDADGNILGVLKGHYINKPDESGLGLFAGRWRKYCGSIRPLIEDGLDD